MAESVDLRYLKGANIDKETPFFSGYGNLAAFAPKDDHYFFLGVSLHVEGIFLSFGDYLNNDDDLVFVCANYKPNAEENLALLVFLEKACFQSWILCSPDEVPKVPKPEEWCLLQLSDYVSPTRTKDATVNSCFTNTRDFQTGCAIFLEHCKTMKQS
jgi:hypothetical protein